MSRRARIDVSVSVATVLAACASPVGTVCNDAAIATCSPSAAQSHIFVSTTADYQSGSLCAMASDPVCLRCDVAPTAGDTVLATHGGLIIAMNYRSDGEDSVTIVDPSTVPGLIRGQIAMRLDGERRLADPRAYVVLDGSVGLVARLFQASLAVVEVEGRPQVLRTVDLSQFAAPAPLPNPVAFARSADALWVVLQRLPPDPTQPTIPGLLVRLDPLTGAPIDSDATRPGVQGIELPCTNPIGDPAVVDGALWLACVGSYRRDDDGGVVVFDPATSAVSWRLRETDALGNIDAIVSLGSQRFALRVSVRAGAALGVGSSRLVLWNAATGALQTIFERPGYTLTEPLFSRAGRLYVGDRGDEMSRRAPAVHAFDPVTGIEDTAALVPFCEPPYDLIERP